MTEPLRVAICEDTPADEDALLDILSRSSIPTQCTVFHSGTALLEAYRPQQFDLLLSDIYMEGLNGVETVARIREIDEELPVAFITTSTEHALAGYRLSVLKYIEKPLREKDIREILHLACMERDSAPALTVQHNRQTQRVPFAHILYLEQQTHQLMLHLHDGSILQIYEKLSVLVPQLEEQGFFIPHKSFAVNLAYVQYIDPELRCFLMQDGKNVPIRRESMSKAKKALEEFLFRRTRRPAP